ncbi:uncharacterized protein LOC129589546 [Paramacrobiotus metropolitanus]|uniref:uncharacterized protein LOC129589546 n=1 Tax=Paramacrobiotus metropolitanus TaxID=2943436 RepID=UPI0024458728|nr:uncharacterized protein LOC129589546 [Paramacrobiotus metropolitanus]
MLHTVYWKEMIPTILLALLLVCKEITEAKDPLQCYSCSGTSQSCQNAYDYLVTTCDAWSTTCVTIRHSNQPLDKKKHGVDSVYYFRGCARGYFSRISLDATRRSRRIVEAEVLMCDTPKCNGKSNVTFVPITVPSSTASTTTGTTTAPCR